MLKLFIAVFIFSLSIHLYSTPVSVDCISTFDVPHNEANNQIVCVTDAKYKTAIKNKEIPQVAANIQLSQRQPSLVESLMAMIFIPGLILLWILRFAKSSK